MDLYRVGTIVIGTAGIGLMFAGAIDLGRKTNSIPHPDGRMLYYKRSTAILFTLSILMLMIIIPWEKFNNPPENTAETHVWAGVILFFFIINIVFLIDCGTKILINEEGLRYFSTFRDSILAMSHCVCNVVPGMSAFGEMRDLAGLVAPRPMLIEAGNYDPIFPIRAVREGVADAKKVFKVFGAADRVETDYFEGRHQISGKKAYDFLKRYLG